MRLRLAHLVSLLVLLPLPAAAQRPMSIVDLISVPALSTPQLSPDGSQVVYVQADADWTANKRVSHLWRVRTDGTGTAQLTSGKDGESQPRWSPDGKWIAFVGKRDGAETAQVHLLPLDGGEARALTTHATAASSPAWSPDGRYVYFMAEDAKSAEQLAREKDKDDVYAFDENMAMRHLWRIDVATRAESRVTSGDFSILTYELSTDGRRIAHHRAPSTVLGDADRGEIWVMDADGANAAAVTKNTVAESGACLSPDGRANPVPVGLERAARDLLQRQPVRDGLDRRAGSRPDARLRQRDHRRRLVKGRPQHLPHRQHGRAQPALRDPGSGRRAQGAHERQPRHHRLVLCARVGTARVRQGRPGKRRRLDDDDGCTGAGEPRVRPLRQGLPAAAAGKDGVEGRRRRDRGRHAVLPARLSGRHSATRWWCRRTAGRRPPTSSASAAGATTPRCWRPRATWCCSRTIAAAPATAIRSCATWSATTS